MAPVKQSIPRGAVIALTAAGVLLVLVAGYFMLVAPQRAQAAHAKNEAAQVRKQIATLEATTEQRKHEPKIQYASLYQVAKAMPDTNDLPDVVLALVQIGRESGITFTKIGANPVTILPLYQQLPLQISFEANFYQLSDFLFRLRNLVRVENGVLQTDGRLYAIDDINIAQPDLGFHYPTVAVSLQVSAFVYGTNAAAAPAPATAAGSTSTTGTDTTSTATTGSTDTTATTTAPTTTTPAALGGNP